MTTTSRKTFRHAAEYAGVVVFHFLLRLWPHSFRRELASPFGAIAQLFTSRRVKIARDNLRSAFPNLSAFEIKRITSDVYRNIAANAIEVIDPASAIATIRVDGETELRLERLVDDHVQGKPLLIVTGHYGNWEVLALYLATRFKELHMMAKEQSNLYFDRLVNRKRIAMGGQILPSHSAARMIPKLLKAGACVYSAADQDAGRDGVMIDFLGRPAAYFRGWALFSYHYQTPVVFALLRREPESLVLELSDIIEPDHFVTRELAVRKMLQHYSDCLASAITAHPEQWLWTHRRWKSGVATPKAD